MSTMYREERTYGRGDDRGLLGRFDWGAVLASVVVGLGVTLLLVALGIAIGALATEQIAGADAGTITGAIGLWTILSALIGAFVGTFVGGRFSRSSMPGAVIYHGLASWSLVTVITVWFGATGVVGLLGTALQGVDVIADAPDAPTALPGIPEQAIGWGGWALFLGLLVTLAVSIIGWWVGARTRPAGFEGTEEMPVRREREEVAAGTTTAPPPRTRR
jgi:hypothetical protein